MHEGSNNHEVEPTQGDHLVDRLDPGVAGRNRRGVQFSNVAFLGTYAVWLALVSAVLMLLATYLKGL